MTEFTYGDVVRCVSALDPQNGPLKENALYVVEAVALHKKSIKVAGDWHSVNRFTKVGKSDLADPVKTQYLNMNPRLEQIERAAGLLSQGFIWAYSDEGSDYWSGVHSKLLGYHQRFTTFKNEREAA